MKPMTQEDLYYSDLLLTIYPCKVPFTVGVKHDRPRSRIGTYYHDNKRIIIHTGKSHDPVETAIHEYAHHIHYTEFEKEKKRQGPHGSEFWQIYGQLMNRAKVLGICDPKSDPVLVFPTERLETA